MSNFMRHPRPVFIIAIVGLLAGCTSPQFSEGAEPPVLERVTSQLPAAAFDAKVLPDDDGFYLFGSVDKRNGQTDPFVWRLGRDYGIQNITILGDPFHGQWVHAARAGEAVEFIGFSMQSGMCCARYFSDGNHADGYFVDYTPFLERWNTAEETSLRTTIDCEERGMFSVADVAGVRYVVGGQASFSTDQPPNFDATHILRLPPEAGACEPTGLTLPREVVRPILLAFDDVIHILPRDGSPGWALDTVDHQLNESSIRLPSNLSYGHATVAQSPNAAYLIGASTTLENRSRIVRIDAEGVQIQREWLDRLAWEATVVWDERSFLILGGADHVEYGDWHSSRAMTRYRPSDDAATQAPPVARFDYSVNNATVVLNGSTSHDPDGFIAKWYWNFIGVEHCYNNFDDCYYAEGPAARHRYPEPGTYEVELTVTDDLGLATTIRENVTVEP